jgi:hypothetical protein
MSDVDFGDAPENDPAPEGILTSCRMSMSFLAVIISRLLEVAIGITLTLG